MKRATLALLFALMACGNGAADTPRVVVTTSILGDLVANVVGDEATVEVLMPLGADPHEFRASSAQVATMAGADLVVANGLGLEEGLVSVLESLAGDGVSILEVAPHLDPIEFEFEHEEDGDDHEEGEHLHDLDPHVWMDPPLSAGRPSGAAGPPPRGSPAGEGSRGGGARRAAPTPALGGAQARAEARPHSRPRRRADRQG